MGHEDSVLLQSGVTRVAMVVVVVVMVMVVMWRW